MKPFNSRRQKDAVLLILLHRTGCGPFDGGGLALALAWQRLHGGEIVVIEGRRLPLSAGHPLLAQHALLQLPDGQLMDAGGVGSKRVALNRFTREDPSVSAEAVRPLAACDLPGATRDEKLVDLLAAALAQTEI